MVFTLELRMKSSSPLALNSGSSAVSFLLHTGFLRVLQLSIKKYAIALVFLLGGAANTQTLNNRLILIGDSTMAPNNGYGEVLCNALSDFHECWNLAKNGRSSKSFREEGLWQDALEKLRSAQPLSRQWILIQFGHNDQPGKPGRSTDLESEYPSNLARYIEEARNANLKPILVTPLIRRSFKNGQHIDDLMPWAQAMKSVASSLNVPLIDLHASSRDKVRSVGEAESDRYAVSPPGTKAFDRTHLGPLGACIFARQVLGQLQRVTDGQINPPAMVDCQRIAETPSAPTKP